MKSNPKPMSQYDKKAIAGLLMIIFLIVLPVTALLSRNGGAALGIFVAFWAGAMAVHLPEWKG